MVLALAVGVNKELRLYWKTEKPHMKCTRRSSVFWFQNHESYFELLLNVYSGCYYIFLRSDLENQGIPIEPFSVTSYIERNDYDRICFANKSSFQSIQNAVAEFSVASIDKCLELKFCPTLNFVLIFYNHVGLSVHLEKDFTSTTQLDLPGGTPSEKSPSCLQKLSEDFSKLLEEGSYHDVEVRCGDDIFKAHRNVLSARSKVFSAMLQSDMVEGQTGQVTIPDMDADTFMQFLRYIYTGQMPELTSDIAESFYEIGDKFAVDGMMEKCSDFLSENLTAENACIRLILADAHSDDRLKNNVIAYIIDQNIHLKDDLWLEFSKCHLKLAFEVLTKLARMEKK